MARVVKGDIRLIYLPILIITCCMMLCSANPLPPHHPPQPPPPSLPAPPQENSKVNQPKLELLIDVGELKVGESQQSKIVVENVGDTIAQDVTVTITSDDLSTHLTKKIGDIPPQESKEVDFYVTAKHTGKCKILVSVKYYNGPSEYTGFAEKVVEVLQSYPTPAHTYTPTPTQTSTPEDVVIDLTSDVIKAKVGQEFSLTLSVVNLIKNPNMTLQVILRPPSGMSVVSSEFAQVGMGQYSGTFFVKPGGSKAVKINVMPNNAGNFTIRGTIVYYFGNDKKNATVKEVSIPIRVVKTENPNPSPLKIPGFSVIPSVISLIVVGFIGFIYATKRRN